MAPTRLQSLPLQTLGLSIAASYAFLGATAIFIPEVELSIIGLKPRPSTGAADAALRTVMLMLGARDWSIAAAMFYFWLRGESRNMGVVVLSGMALCLVDLWVIACKRGGDAATWGLGVGVAIWAVVGLGLLDS